MSHLLLKFNASFRQFFIVCSFVFCAVVSVVFLSSWQNNPSFNNGKKQTNSLTTSTAFKGTLSLNLIGDGQISGTGQGTHIGKFDFFAQDDESNFPYLDGTVVMTAVNGDQIFATHTGNVEELGNGFLKITLDHTITGGTGRFAGVSGNFIAVSIANTNNGTATATLKGMINF
ncbi:MAG: hypothetical protein ABIT96_04435 [Ferruginibacter sp.]